MLISASCLTEACVADLHSAAWIAKLCIGNVKHHQALLACGRNWLQPFLGLTSLGLTYLSLERVYEYDCVELLICVHTHCALAKAYYWDVSACMEFGFIHF